MRFLYADHLNPKGWVEHVKHNKIVFKLKSSEKYILIYHQILVFREVWVENA